MFGYMTGLPIAGAGPDSPSGFAECVHKLVELGHKRIVLLTPRSTRLPEPNRAVLAFLEALKAEGIKTGDYNMPDWDTKEDGLHEMLESLFKLTPPTALVIADKVTFFATRQFLHEKGIRVPGDVSLVCHEHINAFTWSEKAVAYIHWDWGPVSRRLRNWMKNISRNKEDVRQTFVKPVFLPGRTLDRPSS